MLDKTYIELAQSALTGLSTEVCELCEIEAKERDKTVLPPSYRCRIATVSSGLRQYINALMTDMPAATPDQNVAIRMLISSCLGYQGWLLPLIKYWPTPEDVSAAKKEHNEDDKIIDGCGTLDYANKQEGSKRLEESQIGTFKRTSYFKVSPKSVELKTAFEWSLWYLPIWNEKPLWKDDGFLYYRAVVFDWLSQLTLFSRPPGGLRQRGRWRDLYRLTTKRIHKEKILSNLAGEREFSIHFTPNVDLPGRSLQDKTFAKTGARTDELIKKYFGLRQDEAQSRVKSVETIRLPGRE